MIARSLADDLVDWASADRPSAVTPALDRDSRDTILAFKVALATPRAINVVERIESLAKSLWGDVLSPEGVRGGATARQCGSFFSDLGFLFKYKPYGVKIASPFGYSLFDLKDGQGFSFQLHSEPKLEAFHILRTKSRSLIYISSREEWDESGQQWARDYCAERSVDDPLYVYRPQPGDVIEVAQTEVVHAVLGCTLEEYASCSVDAVERLFDQNERVAVDIPAGHPRVADLLAASRHGQPLRRLERTETGWKASDCDGEVSDIIAVKNELRGCRLSLSPGQSCKIPASDEELTLLVAVDQDVRVEIEGERATVDVGCFRCVPPGLEASVESVHARGSVAVHKVSRELIQINWTR